VLGSLLVHAGLVALLVSYGAAPDLGFEFELPAEVEFGVSGSAALPDAASGPGGGRGRGAQRGERSERCGAARRGGA
jgi:hypothetical protein